MAKVNTVQKAQKDYPEHGIKKGERYYWWKFPRSNKIYSKTYPRRSQLTQSGFLASLYDLEDQISDMNSEDFESNDDIKSEIDRICSEIESLFDQCNESLDNMPDALRESSSSGQLLQERIEALESWKSDLESIDTDIDDSLDDEKKKERMQEIIEEIQQTGSGL